VTLLGALLAGCAVAAAVTAAPAPSAVGRRLARLAPRPAAHARISVLVAKQALRQSGLGLSEAQVVAAKALCALVCAALAALAGQLLGIGPVVVVGAAYGGFVLPSAYIDRRAAARLAESDRALVAFVECLEALVASGRPAESAILAVAARGIGAGLADDALRAAARAYALGAPLFPAVARESERAGLDALARFARDLERSRDLGRGAFTVLRDERERLRAAERARSLDAAGRVEGRLMLVMVLCYLPALMLLVVIPLFVGLLNGLFA
jgi:Flp pilus assembly protein TadB